MSKRFVNYQHILSTYLNRCNNTTNRQLGVVKVLAILKSSIDFINMQFTIS